MATFKRIRGQSSPEYAKNDDNGFLFKAGDVEGLVEALKPLLADMGLRKRMGQRSRERIEQWSYEECLQGVDVALGASTKLNNGDAHD